MSPPKPPARFTGISAFSGGARGAGATLALVYLLGLVPGSIVAVLGGVVLVTWGRALVLERTAAAMLGAAVAGIGGGLGIGALRWGSPDLAAISGAQSVLGPTLVVEPALASAAAWVAAAAVVVALSVWFASFRTDGRLDVAWSLAEVAVVALAFASVFWGPALLPPDGRSLADVAVEAGGWLLVVLGAAAPAVGAGLFLRRLAPFWRWSVLGLSGVLVLTSAGLLAGARAAT